RRVAIVSESFAQRYFEGRDPIGLKIGVGWGSGTRYFHEIVGISKDAQLVNLRDRPQRDFFVPYTQWNVLTGAYFFVRTPVEAPVSNSSIREVIKRHNPEIPVVGYRAVEQQ